MIRNLLFKLRGFYYRAVGYNAMIGYKYSIGENERIIEHKFWIIK